jgi:hypothetical protein
MISRLAILVVVSAVAIASGCKSSHEVVRGDLFGTFVANGGTGEDLLILRSDRTYLHICCVEAGKPAQQMIGKWNFYYDKGKPRVTFSDFIWGIDYRPWDGSKGALAKPGFWDVGVYWDNGSIEFIINQDTGWRYIKRG